METRPSGAPARVGLLLLNLIAPGAALLRPGRWRKALVLMALSLTPVLFIRTAPPVPLAVLLILPVLVIVLVFVAMIMTWRDSRRAVEPRPWYGRWYGIAGAVILFAAIIDQVGDRDRVAYRSFYLPADSMAPSLVRNDRLIAYMGSLGPLRRGDLVLARSPHGDTYIKRVAALGGDRFAMRAGLVVLNGQAVPQRFIAMDRVADPMGDGRARRLAERFPGEPSEHQLYDTGPSPGDDVPEMIVPPGRVVLLGDNRDRSADSRYSVEEYGLGGPVPESAILGRPQYMSWGSSRPFGEKLSPKPAGG